MDIKKLENESYALRKELVELHYRTKSAHLGSELSALDILVALYYAVKKPEDIVVISKSHIAIGVYALWHRLGIINDEDYATFHHNGSKLAEHVTFPDTEFKAGSLGHGLPFSVGVAYAKFVKHEPGRVFCLIGDGETDEGSVKEAIRIARELKLDNLVIICDNNGWRAYDRTNLSETTIDGHNFDALVEALGRKVHESPNFIWARTVMAKGLPEYEDRQEGHYKSPTKPEA